MVMIIFANGEKKVLAMNNGFAPISKEIQKTKVKQIKIITNGSKMDEKLNNSVPLLLIANE